MLGELAHKDHRVLDADQAWQGAVRNLDARDAARVQALIGRARARTRLQRLGDALADLEEAATLAAELGDPALELVATLHRATALDIKEEYEEAERAAHSAAALLDRVPDRPDLRLGVELATGRTLFRAHKWAECADRLRRVLGSARDLGEIEIQKIAGLLLGPALVELAKIDEAERVFSDLIEVCRAEHDNFHLGAAYGNRAWLSFARGDVEATAEDLRLVIQLAREGGQAHLERAATHNLAEDRLWQGSLDEALALARRSLAILRAHEGAQWLDQLLIARILAARSECGELRDVLAALKTEDLPESAVVTADVLACVADDASEATWAQRLESAAAIVSVDTRLELALLAVTHERFPAAMRDEVRELAMSHPIWSRRLKV
jgi:tetratricopeptide (TPR) repeat protein